jgi:type II secretory pathway pseudopilin PulG
MMNNKSFTIIELLISVAIFSIVIAVVSGIFISAQKAQRKTLAVQQVLSQTGYLMEHMSRSIRMAKKDLTGECLTAFGAKYNYETDAVGRDRIRFLNYRNQCQEFFLDSVSNQIRQRESIDNTALNFASSLPLTATSTIEVVSFNIGPSESWRQPPIDFNQPRITLFLEIKAKGENQPGIKFQTTISQRNIDIQR